MNTSNTRNTRTSDVPVPVFISPEHHHRDDSLLRESPGCTGDDDTRTGDDEPRELSPGVPPTEPPDPDYTRVLILRPLKSDVPAHLRVRAALKVLLRSFKLRCEHCGPADLYRPADKLPSV